MLHTALYRSITCQRKPQKQAILIIFVFLMFAQNISYSIHRLLNISPSVNKYRGNPEYSEEDLGIVRLFLLSIAVFLKTFLKIFSLQQDTVITPLKGEVLCPPLCPQFRHEKSMKQ